jgi:EmrB/QacA subfamily drug resistance transporter
MTSLLTEPPRPAIIRDSPRAHWYVVATVCIGAFMGQLDASIVTVALPRIGRDLHAALGAVEWVALAYLLILITTVATVGHLADAIGRKLLYTYGFAVFTASSALCGLAPSLPVLIVARVLQALGAAMLQANSIALITEAMPRPLLTRAIGAQGTAQALGLALGPAIGGVLLAVGGWRLIFLLNVPAGTIGLVLGWLLLPRSRSRRDIGRGDAPGALLLALAAGAPLAYLSLGNRLGYGDPGLLVALAAGVLGAVWFVRHERRAAFPLINLLMLRRRALSVGLSSGLLSFLILFGVLFVVPYHLSALHRAPVMVGLELALLPAGIGITAPLAGRLSDHLSARALTSVGMALTGAGLLVIDMAAGTGGLLAGLALAGVGLGAFTPSNNAAIMSAAPGGHAGLVGGLLNMTRGTGTALGVAVAGALYTAGGFSLAIAVLGVAGLAAAACLTHAAARPAPCSGSGPGPPSG